MITKTAKAFYANIYMAGDIAQARHLCAEYCFGEGLCVTLTATDFIYTGGRESGFVVGLVNYPRFTASEAFIFKRAEELAVRLICGLHQHSALIQTPDQAVWKSRRIETSPERSCLTCSYRVAGMCEHDGDCDEREHWTPRSPTVDKEKP